MERRVKHRSWQEFLEHLFAGERIDGDIDEQHAVALPASVANYMLDRELFRPNPTYWVRD